MEYREDSYYVTVTEVFKRKDGTSSWYNMLSGDGQFTSRLRTSERHPTKELMMKLIHERVRESVRDIDDFTCNVNEYGVTYERFVKMAEHNVDHWETVKEGEHTDHEVFEVELFYIQKDTDIFSKLK